MFLCCVSQLCATDYVVISEIMYDTPLSEDSTTWRHNYGEYIELYNESSNIVDLSGWSIETINPHQVFTIPTGILLHPKSTLIVAYGEEDIISYSVGDMTEEEFMGGMTDFHWLYEITDLTLYQIVLQTSFTLPNQYTILLLKDDLGVTKDSVRYEDPYPESLDNARNNYPVIYDGDAYRGCLNSMYSLQRTHVSFAEGNVVYISTDWLGRFMNTQAGVYENNTLGYIPEYFHVGDYTTTPIQNSLFNYIQDITPNVAMSCIDTGQILDNPTQATVKRTYYDAMYRPTLTLLFNQTPNQENLVTLKEYDSYARPTKAWLPIVVDVDNLTSITFKNNASQYYSGDTRPFIEQSYSTVTWDNGIIKNELTGSQKAGADMGSNKIEYVSRGNVDNEVKLFYVTPDGLLRCDDYYSKKSLRVTETIDEDGNIKVVYTNLQNQVVMEKIANAKTYYVYNDLNQLCFVLPPLASNQIDVGVYDDDNDILKKYAYVYKYDNRGNQIYKRLPGCEPTLMVYDISNSLVMSQTGNQRQRGTYWTVYKYDEFRRLTYVAEMKANDTYEYYLAAFKKWYMIEYFSTGTHTYPMAKTGYSRGFFHSYPTELLTVNYYDTYEFLNLMADSIHNQMNYVPFNGNDTCANAKGLLTGTRTYYLTGADGYSETVYYYDYRGREIQRRSTNHLGGYDVLSTKYDFVNNITDTWSSQSTNNGITTIEHYHYTYDHANRLDTTIYTFNDEPPIVLQSYLYDELGRVRSRHIYDGVDSITFAYDIRNQVTQIKSSGYEQNYYYTQTFPVRNELVQKAYNGNIAATTWTYGNKTNGYMYYYDEINRLQSTYGILDNQWCESLYSELYQYDAHGNITCFMRFDDVDLVDDMFTIYNGNQLIEVEDDYDSQNYSSKEYHDNNDTGNDFAYDANGNMIYDQDRGIAAIRYNLLNLPDTIQFTNGNLIIHRYDAAGNRLETKYLTKKSSTTVPLGNVLSTPKRPEIFYITRDAFHNNIVYTANNNDAYGIEFVHNPEGYIRYYGPEEHYHFYYIKDLLGNIRETYVHPSAGYKECIQRTQYYPSGLPWVEAYSPSEQPWKYNGKEFVEMHGLDEYDSKARWYYPAICRTTTMDPLAEKYYSTSPYAWCGNNPVKNVDLDGKDVWELNEQGSLVNMIADTTQDAIRMNGKQISFEYNSISSVSQDDYQTTFSFGNEDIAAGAFKFLADNSNVEYGLVNSARKSTIVTQHLNSRVNVNGIIDATIGNKDFITSIIHNHPGNSGPSGFSNKQGDKQAFQNIENRLGYEIQAYVYQPDKQSLWFFTPSYRGNGGLGWNCFYPNQVGTQSYVIPSRMYNIKNFFGYKIKL